MKHKLLFLVLLITTCVTAQIVNIPDVNFKNKLLAVIDTNGDGEIEMTEALTVYSLDVSNSSIASLEGISSFSNIQDFSCSNNSISILDLSNLSNLQYASLDNLPLSSLNSSGLLSLKQIHISGSLLTQIDLSSSPLLEYYNIYNNPYLTYINIKNGTNIEFPSECYIANNPVLNLICVDPGEDVMMLQNPNYATIPMSSDCGNETLSYNIISGNLGFDIDANGCDANDSNPNFSEVSLFDGTSYRYGFTNDQGHYAFYTQEGTFTVMPVFEQLLFTFSPDNGQTNFPAINGSVFTQDFCLTANGINPDVEVVIVPFTTLTPGFNAKYKVICRNKGNQPVSGTVNFMFNDTLLNYVTSSAAPSTTGSGVISWNYDNLLPFQHTLFMVTLVPDATAGLPIAIGDVLNFSATVTPVQNDITPTDNSFVFAQTAVASYDPNNIVCMQGESLPTNKIGEYLNYTINFENIGTAAATKVVVTDAIDTSKYDISSIQILNSSNEVVATAADGQLVFTFNAINLAPQAYGNVTFKIKSLATLEAGDSVMNQASIVFDFNEPVITNQATTTYQDTAGIGVYNENNLKIYPNPAINEVTIEGEKLLQQITLYDMQGRILVDQKANANTSILDISAQPAGIYFLKVTSVSGTSTQKLVKN